MTQNNPNQAYASLSMAQNQLLLNPQIEDQETAHVQTTVNEGDSEMTTHQLSDNIWLHVVKDEYNDEFPQQALFASNLTDYPAQDSSVTVSASQTFGDRQTFPTGLFTGNQPNTINADLARIGPYVRDDAHHIYMYTLEVTDPTIQVDIRLDFGESANIEVIDDENVLREDGRFIVVGSVMPMTS